MRGILTLALSPVVDRNEAFERSFDFSKLPNLQEVELRVSWIGGGLRWIPAALSTLRPATSPRLSTIQLDFSHRVVQSIQAAFEYAGSDLRWVADEVARIVREFEGAVTVTVLRDSQFEMVFDTLKARFNFCRNWGAS